MLSVSKKVLVGRGVAMKGEIFFRCTDGTEIPVKEVRGLEGNGVLIIIMAQILRKEDMQKMEQNIETRLGNGLDKIEGSEAETVIIAGMGGILICDILKKDTEKLNSIKQLVLQPQRDVYKVRKCLHSLGFKIDDEEMVFENGKYYNIIIAVKGVETYESDADYIFGRRLIEKKSQVLKAYINSRIKKYENILARASFDKTSESLENINYLYKLSKEVVKNL